MGDIMSKRYIVDFYDMFDGWIHASEFRNWEYDDFEEAKKVCDDLMKELDDSNKRAGEHYGVIDTRINKEIYCTKCGGFL